MPGEAEALSAMGSSGGPFQVPLQLFGVGQSVFNDIMTVKNFNYQRELSRLQMQREDNAVQRRVADLRKAHLSPTLAAGSAASASAPIVPQMGKMNSASEMLARAQIQAAMIQSAVDVSKTYAEKDLIDMQKRKTKVDADYTELQRQIDARDLQIAKDTGVSYHADDKSKFVSNSSNVLREKFEGVIRMLPPGKLRDAALKILFGISE